MAEAIQTQAGAAPDAERSRGAFAATIVVAHAVKHALISGLSSVILPEIKLALSLSATQVGTLGSVQQFSGWFATMGAGYLGDRFTNRTNVLLSLSLGISGFALLFIAFSQTYLAMLVGMLLVGFGPSFFHPPAVGALSRKFADRRAFAISLHGTGGSIGEVLGPVTFAGLLALLYWRDVLQLVFIPAIVTAGLLFFLLREQHAHNHGAGTTFGSYLGSFRDLMRHRVLMLILAVTALRSVGQATTAIFLPVYLREDLGYSAGLVGLYISMSQLAGIGSQPVMGQLTDRFGHKAVLIPALMGFAILLALVPLADGKIQLAVVILALGMFVFSLQSVLTSAAVEQAGHEVHSTVVSLIYASSFIGSLSPAVAGVLADAYGLKSTFVFSAIAGALAVVVLAMTKLPERHRPSARVE